MGLTKPETSLADQMTEAPSRGCDLFIALCLLIISTCWAISSYRTPGGILHGARWILSSYNVKIWLGFRPSGMTSSYGDECRLGYEEPLEAVRTTFGSKGTIVYGWPSTGGLWVHGQCYGVELNFLGLSRFEPSATTRYSNEEDEFCKLLERIGGRFYESESAYNNLSVGPEYRRLPQMWYGWPGWPDKDEEGGVWALQIKDFEGSEIGVARIRNAFNMEERCKAIKMLGGQFYQKWEDVPKGDPNPPFDTDTM